VGRLFIKVEILAILGSRSRPRAPIGVKVCMAKRTNVPLGCAKFHVSRCKQHIFAPMLIDIPKLCIVVQEIETILKGCNHFLILHIVVPIGCMENSG